MALRSDGRLANLTTALDTFTTLEQYLAAPDDDKPQACPAALGDLRETDCRGSMGGGRFDPPTGRHAPWRLHRAPVALPIYGRLKGHLPQPARHETGDPGRFYHNSACPDHRTGLVFYGRRGGNTRSRLWRLSAGDSRARIRRFIDSSPMLSTWPPVGGTDPPPPPWTWEKRGSPRWSMRSWPIGLPFGGRPTTAAAAWSCKIASIVRHGGKWITTKCGIRPAFGVLSAA